LVGDLVQLALIEKGLHGVRFALEQGDSDLLGCEAAEQHHHRDGAVGELASAHAAGNFEQHAQRGPPFRGLGHEQIV